jgi:hypothetical protein
MATKEEMMDLIQSSNGDEQFSPEQMKMINNDDDLKKAYDQQFGSEGNFMGGRRRSKKNGKGTKKRKENHVLASWRKFVRKVQHEEKITYPEAMKRASKRKSEWQRGGAAEGEEEGYDGEDEQMGGSAGDMKSSAGDVQDFDGQYNQYGDAKVGGRRSRRRRSRGQRGGSHTNMAMPDIAGGSRRRRSRGTKKRRGSRRR